MTGLFIVAQNWKLLKCPSTVELINIAWYVHTRDYHSIIGKHQLLIYSTTWMNCRIIRWGERVQTRKTTHCMISLIWNSRKGKVIYRGGPQISNDGHNRRMHCKGKKKPGNDGNVVSLGRDGGFTGVCLPHSPPNYTFTWVYLIVFIPQ